MSQWVAVLATCDLLMAREEILQLHQLAQAQAAREGKDAYFTAPYVEAWYRFRDNPTVTTAAAFLDAAPPLIHYFESCAPGGMSYDSSQYLRERGLS